MSVIIAADLHLGATTHGTTMRREEAERVLAFIAGQVGESHYDLVLAGDTYETPNPPSWATRLAQEYLSRGNTTAIRGNHDAFNALKNTNLACIVDRPRVIDSGDMDIALVPWFSRAYVATNYPDLAVGEQNRYMALALERIVADLAAKKRKGVPMVCVTHFTISGATWDSGVQPLVGESADFIAPWSAFDRPEFDLVVSGHLHNPQELHDGRLVYVGSAFHTAFSKHEYQTRILQVALTNSGRVQWQAIPTPAIEFVSIEINEGWRHDEVEGKVVRAVGELPAGEQTAALLQEFTRQMYEYGALRVAKPAVRFTRHEARATRALPVEVTPEEALREYAESVGGEVAARLDELLEKHATITRRREHDSCDD